MNPIAEELSPQEEVVEEQAEPAEQVEQAEEPVAEAPEEEPKEKKKESVVPYGALHEERQKRKEIQAELNRIQQEQQQRYALLEQRLQALQGVQQQPKGPSFEEDPVGALKHGVEMTQAQLQEMRQHQEREYYRQQQEAVERQQMERFTQSVRADVEAFSKETPDYGDAINYARQVYTKQNIALGMPEDMAWQMTMKKEYELAAEAMRNGRSPAVAAYEVAKAFGWKGKEGEQKIASLQKGTQAAKSLGSGGTPPKGQVTLEQLADMNDEDFAAFMKAGKWQKLG